MDSNIPSCQECGGALDIDPKCVIEFPVIQGDMTIGRRHKVAHAALCTRCEFCIEIITDPQLLQEAR